MYALIACTECLHIGWFHSCGSLRLLLLLVAFPSGYATIRAYTSPSLSTTSCISSGLHHAHIIPLWSSPFPFPGAVPPSPCSHHPDLPRDSTISALTQIDCMTSKAVIFHCPPDVPIPNGVCPYHSSCCLQSTRYRPPHSRHGS